jgi:RHS repeat-associated protein
MARCSTTWKRHWTVPASTAPPFKVPIDPNGNLASKTEGTDNWTYTWNAENQLTKVEKNGAEVARFAYDPQGRRVEKVASGLTTSYTYAKGDILREVRGSATLRYVAAGTDEPLADDDGTNISYFHADGLGSVAKATDSGGGVMLTRQYDAWGALQIGADQSGYSFTGREWDPEIGFYYYRARYYDPRSARFIAEDPLGVDGGLNLFAYVDNEPTTRSDPWGLAPCSNVCGTAKAMGMDGGDWGGVICCNGKKYACNWSDPNNEPGMEAYRGAPSIIEKCITEHERVHIPDTVACPCDGSMSRPDFKKGRGGQSECAAHRATLACLIRNRKTCKTDPCRASVDRFMADAAADIRRYCGR